MSQSLSGEFPGQELEKCLNDLQAILDTAKPLTTKIVLDKKLREAIIKCVVALQALLSEAQSEYTQWENDLAGIYQQDLDKRQQEEDATIDELYALYQQGKITWEEYQNALENLNYR